nr:hypothetical protein Itr_chr14CG16410 [Ipomoea trifida]
MLQVSGADVVDLIFTHGWSVPCFFFFFALLIICIFLLLLQAFFGCFLATRLHTVAKFLNVHVLELYFWSLFFNLRVRSCSLQKTDLLFIFLCVFF